jgi:hypothetical protein
MFSQKLTRVCSSAAESVSRTALCRAVLALDQDSRIFLRYKDTMMKVPMWKYTPKSRKAKVAQGLAAQQREPQQFGERGKQR